MTPQEAIIPAPDTAELARLIGSSAQIGPGGSLTISSLVDGKAFNTDVKDKTRVSPASNRNTFTALTVDAEKVDEAIASVRSGYDNGGWGRTTARDRAKVLWRAAELMSQDAPRLAQLLIVEAGKPVREARGEVAAAINAFEYYAGLSRDIGGRTSTGISNSLLAMTLREPAGVAGIITPWNFPLAILAQKLPAALAAGCTAVVKPSPLTPLTALAMADILFEAGLPEDALSIVLGDGSAGARIVSHADTDVISFTGSTGVGRAIASSAGSNRLKPMAIEAGGKTPVIVLRDADLESTVEGLLFGSFFNQGQVCVAGSRIMAEAPIVQELTERLAARSQEIRVGDPRLETTEMGPLIGSHHFDSVLGKIRESEAAGAIVAAGGGQVTLAGTTAGPFLAPTVLRTEEDLNPAIAEEIFGPVTVVQSFKDVNDVVRRSNSQRFGLAASVWGHDIDSALEITKRLRVGTVWVNGSTDSFPEMPLGGRRDSGFGAEFGREGMEVFTALKTVQIRLGGAAAPWYGAR